MTGRRSEGDRTEGGHPARDRTSTAPSTDNRRAA